MQSANWYVLQVMTGEELTVACKLRDQGVTVMTPQERRRIRCGGSWHSKDFVLFRGYVFVKLEYTAEIYHIIRRLPSVIRFLGSPPEPLWPPEVAWLRLLDHAGDPLCPTKMIALPNGKLQPVEGILCDFESEVLRINRHRRQAEVQITFAGHPHRLKLSINILNRDV